MLSIAKSSFPHDGKRIQRGQVLNLSPQTTKRLVRQGLVQIEQPVPMVPAGKPLSALPVGQASQQTTVNESGSGAKQRRRRRKQEA